MMQDVIEMVHVSGNQTKPVFLPHCTWDKFGDILANSGGRCVGLFDELVSFFATMNMYSSTKMQLSDTKEYQDFLQMYTGKTKTRETGIGYIKVKHHKVSPNPSKVYILGVEIAGSNIEPLITAGISYNVVIHGLGVSKVCLSHPLLLTLSPMRVIFTCFLLPLRGIIHGISKGLSWGGGD